MTLIDSFYMSELLQDFQRKLVFPLDFPSQRYTEKLQQITLLIGAIVASIVGLTTQSLKNLIVVYVVVVALTALAVLPAYPAYTKRKLQWVQPQVNISSE